MEKATQTIVVLSVALLAVYSLNLVSTTGMFLSISEKAEYERPANIEIIKLTDYTCTKCFDISPLINHLKSSAKLKAVKEESLDSNSEEGRQLARELGIENVPTVVLKGEIGKKSASDFFGAGWRRAGNAVFYQNPSLPYINLNTKTLVGVVESTILTDPSCPECFDFTQVTDSFQGAGVFFGKNKLISYTSSEGQDLVRKFDLKKVPSIIFSSSIKEYQQIAGVWDRIDHTEKEGFIAIGSINPAYRDLESNRVVGLVEAVYITDTSCKDCYDVKLNKEVLDRFGVSVSPEKTLDLSSQEGRGIVSKYKITKLPTIILSPDAKYYQSLVEVWKDVGTVEADGWFVMRKPELLGKTVNVTA